MTPEEKLFRRMMLGLGIVAGTLCLLLAAGSIVLLARPGWAIASAASWWLGRDVTVGAARLQWGDRVAIVLSDVAIANAPGGSDPRMAHADEIMIKLALGPGAPRLAELRLLHPVVLLEFVRKGVGNWSDGGSARSDAAARRAFPGLRHAQVIGGKVAFRYRSGRALRLEFDKLDIRSATDRDPVMLQVAGSYNGSPLLLSGQIGSFRSLQDTSAPFAATFTIADPGSDAKISFAGTIAEPLSLDGFDGQVRIEARHTGRLLGPFGVKDGFWAAAKARVEGRLEQKQDRWALLDAAGELLGTEISGSLRFLDQFPRPDQVELAARSPRLDLGPISRAAGGQGGADGPRPDLGPGIVVDFDVAVAELVFGRIRPTGVAIAGRIAPGETSIERLKFAYAGGSVTGSGSARAVGAASSITANVALENADLGALAAVLGSHVRQVSGRLSARAAITMTGTSVTQALARSSGTIVAEMKQGRIARALIEAISTDLRSIFRRGEGWVEIDCLLGVMRLERGVGRIGPLTLQTPEAVVEGAGHLRVSPAYLDVTLKTDSETTGFFALDQPLRIHGPPDRLAVTPGGTAGPGHSDASTMPDMSSAPRSLRRFAEANSCRGANPG
jgi:uncharacterized protein involved in outer membrane biogenesis